MTSEHDRALAQISEVTYVITALGCRLPFARVLCCRRMR